MRQLALVLVLSFAPAISYAATISYNLCNKHGVRDMPIVAKDKKNNMSIVYSGSVAKDRCVAVSSSTGNGDHAEIELKVDQGAPYGVSWIKAGDDVNF